MRLSVLLVPSPAVLRGTFLPGHRFPFNAPLEKFGEQEMAERAISVAFAIRRPRVAQDSYLHIDRPGTNRYDGYILRYGARQNRE